MRATLALNGLSNFLQLSFETCTTKSLVLLKLVMYLIKGKICAGSIALTPIALIYALLHGASK